MYDFQPFVNHIATFIKNNQTFYNKFVYISEYMLNLNPYKNIKIIF